MKIIAFTLAFAVLPFASRAVVVVNCDPAPHTLVVLSEGMESRVKLNENEQFANYSNMLSFQVEDITPVMLTRPEDKYCISKGKLSTSHCCSNNMQPREINGVMVR